MPLWENKKKWIKAYFVDFYFITVFSIYSSRLVAIFLPFIGFVCIKEETSGEKQSLMFRTLI